MLGTCVRWAPQARLGCSMLVLCGLGLAAACSRDVAAKVNGKAISTQAFEAQAARNLARFGGAASGLSAAAAQRIRQSVLRRRTAPRRRATWPVLAAPPAPRRPASRSPCR
ncbi:MAG: hypothetical protein EOO40_08750 [Deltaproteobacteria bacterium]|nr:MAG: hypothetical protein EOO40_08750 [Deltaproteobacteria bacterium]